MSNKPFENYPLINQLLDILTPTIVTNGTDQKSVEEFCFALMIIMGGLCDGVDVDAKRFQDMALMAFQQGKNSEKIEDKALN